MIEHLEVLGVNIDSDRNSLPNSYGERIISREDARVICTVIPTNEEKMIALDAIYLGEMSASVEYA